MIDHFGEVPALPIVLPLGLVVFAVILWRLCVKQSLTPQRCAVAAVLAIYAAGIAANTLFPIFLTMPTSSEPWTPAIVLIPIQGYEVADAIMNVAVFVPLGALIPLLVSRVTWVKALGVAAGVSLVIETAQLLAQRAFAGGHIADINDFMFNVAGGALGYGLFLLLNRSARTSRQLVRFRLTNASLDK